MRRLSQKIKRNQVKKRFATVEEMFRENEKNLKLLWIAGKDGGARVIRENSIHRPGLALTGFFDYFADKRVQIIGGAENAYLKHLSEKNRGRLIKNYLDKEFPCIIFARGIRPDPLFMSLSDKFGIPVFISQMVTSNLINGIIIYLDRKLSPAITVIGNLVDVHGTGVLIRGASGIGKSECVLALIRRGFALVADDVVKISRYGGSQLVGTSAMDELSGYMEIRGLGLINIIQMFGVSSFRNLKEIDLAITLKNWNETRRIERTGFETEAYRLLGIDIPHLTLPVAPGRETANLVEIAAQEFRMRALGLHSGKTLNEILIKRIAKK